MDSDLPDPIADAAVEVGQSVRYLRLHRTSGNDYLHENLLEGYNNNHTGEHLYVCSPGGPTVDRSEWHGHPAVRKHHVALPERRR